MPIPDPVRLAHHEAGHAVVQHWVAKGRFRVLRVSLDTMGEAVAGSSLLDQEADLGLYEFGLVVLAGIAAENRYFKDFPPQESEVWGAAGDVEEWLATARDLLQSEARVELVTRNVMRRLDDFFTEAEPWRAVTRLAEILVTEGSVEGDRLTAVLEGEGQQ